MTSFEEILSELEKHTGIPRDDLNRRINKKQEDLSGLVSLEGAAHLVARELGINMLDESKRKLEIKNIVSGMRNVNVVGRIYKISNIVGFKRSDGSDGRVVNFYIGDSSGYSRVVLWDKQVNLVEERTLKIGDSIQVFNGLAKENVFGEMEINLGKYGGIRSVDDSLDLPSLDELNQKFINAPKRVEIAKIDSGIFEVNGSIVQIFDTGFIFRVCPVCGSGIKESEGKLRCEDHGIVESKPELFISAVIDDGTDSLRVVFFRDLAEKVCGISANELSSIEEGKRYDYVKDKIMGKELKVVGKVKKNKKFDRLEMVANSCKDLNAPEKIKELVKEIELKLGNFTT